MMKVVFTSFFTIIHFISILEGSGAQKKKKNSTNKPFQFWILCIG